MRSIAERENRQTFASLTLTGTLNVSGAITGASYSGGAVSGTTATFSGAGTFDSLVLNKATLKGIKVDTATPTYPWQDMLGDIVPRQTGASAPQFNPWQGGIYAYQFNRAGMQEVFVNFHIIHDHAVGTDVYVHSHWTTAAAPVGDCNWLFEVTYAKGYDQAAFEGTAGSSTTITTSVTQTPTGAFRHNIAEVQLSAPDGLIASSTNVSITAAAAILTSASALWTAGDIGRTVRVVGAGAAGGNLDTTISAFTSTTQVTLAAVAGTTVTAQPNFRWRVLDSNLLEVDGVIAVRCWRDQTRAADTITVDPFLHFVDCHYQSTGIGTKQRNGPAFYT